MTAQTWFVIGIVGFSIAGILLVAAILMFLRFNIPAIIGDLTGRTAARQIEQFRQSNSATGAKSFRPDPFNVQRGKLTEPVQENYSIHVLPTAHPSKRLGKKRKTESSGGTTGIGIDGTVSLETDTADGTSASNSKGYTSNLSTATTILTEEEEFSPFGATTQLSEEVPVDVATILREEGPKNVTTILSETEPSEEKEVQVVSKPVNGTTILSQSIVDVATDDTDNAKISLKIVKSIKVVHTDEVIE